MIGNGTGDWDVPVGGMGHVTDGAGPGRPRGGRGDPHRGRGDGIDPDGEVAVRYGDGEYTLGAGHMLANLAPAALARLPGDAAAIQARRTAPPRRAPS